MLTPRSDEGRVPPAAAHDDEGHRNQGSPETWRSLSGWGNAPVTTSQVVEPADTRALQEVIPLEKGQIARGLGRSYGDAAQLAGGTVIDMTAMTGVWVDAETGLVTTLGGTSLGAIIDTVVPMGWFLPVTPGTRHVTVGGAIAADVHGKNHHRNGSFGQFVESLELVTADASTVTVTPDMEAFLATVGGMGLTGSISRATFRLTPVESPWMSVDTVKTGDLHAVMQVLAETDRRARYSVAWLDLTRSGGGRGIVSAAEHATREEAWSKAPYRASGGSVASPPAWAPRVVTGRSVDLFNQLWYSMAPSHETGKLESLDSFFYPLDRIANWNRLYGSRGFLQYQFVVPVGEEDALVDVAETLANAPTPVSLAVLKRMGPSKGGLLSFPMPGWTLALDMPLGDPGLATTLDVCDRNVTEAGGRVYLAKDSRLRADLAREMYPNLRQWREARSRLDPRNRLRSNLSERLELTA